VYGAAEGVICGTLSKSFAMDVILLHTKGICDIVGSLEVGFGVMLPVEEVVVV